MNKAFVFNCGFNGLSIIQDLGRKGVECLALDSVRSIGTYSRYAKYVKCPDPATDETAFVDFLFTLCAREEFKPVLFPTNDHWAMAVSRHKTRLSEVALPCVGDWAAVRQVLEKDHFYEVGQVRGYRTPRSYALSELATLADGDFPIAAKPKHRRISADASESGYHGAMDRLRLTILADRPAVTAFLRAEEQWLEHLIFQQFVPGLSDAMHTVGIYATPDHEVIAQFTGRKIRGYPHDIGDCIVGENTSMPTELLDETRRIVADLGLSGIAEFEYKKDSHSNEFKLIEVNPRSWSWIGITEAAGSALPWTAYLNLTGKMAASQRQSQTMDTGAVRYARVLDDALNTLLRYRTEHPAWSRGARDWWTELHSAGRVVYAEFQQDEPRVAVQSTLWALKRTAAYLYSRLRERRGGSGQVAGRPASDGASDRRPQA